MTGGWVDDYPSHPPIGTLGWIRVLLRGGLLGVVIFGGLGILLLVRLIERPLFGATRPITPHITQFVCRASLRIMGICLRVMGKPMEQHGAVVANHAAWPGIGWLARATGTVFIARKSADAKLQQGVFEARLRDGHRLLFFPEGTSTDTLRVLPFKPTLFAAFYTHGMEQVMHIQPASVIYHPPIGADLRLYGWWGDMDFASHFKLVLASPRRGVVEVILHDQLAVDDFGDRKALSAACEAVIRASHEAHLSAV
jgi:lyso-ornithine lipid O-acyltransferase